MDFEKKLKRIEDNLLRIDENLKHAVVLKESFIYPAHNGRLRKAIRGTRNSTFYGICLKAIYFEFIMTLMRTYDSPKKDRASFNNIINVTRKGFKNEYERRYSKRKRKFIDVAINTYDEVVASNEYKGLKDLRNKLLAHTSLDIASINPARYGDPEVILDKSLFIIKSLNYAFGRRQYAYAVLGKVHKRLSKEFWNNMIKY